ncbi:nicotinamide riboside transporter PnuC [Kibdelosporangium banguiense]|uniref:Nicotinamide riboside transporter PnuC n=1 Tax=Kibdelosporangium banguiense TaxID=1365924 RepID=A0ABS4TC42_9PSEU|nr:DUF4244 domain-containing protein [Kibdelosporangium banguiense]MBP2321428.1 nicotinamide riboside transporter PnuC [Kibdelosporangium banguiense]
MHDFTDEGTTTVEYAVATIAAAGFGIALILIARSEKVQNWIVGLIEKAMTVT